MFPRSLLLLAAALTLARPVLAQPSAPVQQLIHLDQFGWLPDAVKVAVLADPQTGYDAALAYTPGSVIQVRDWHTGAVVFSGAPAQWNSGANHSQSGNKAWRFDFTPVTKWGSYYLFDPSNNVRSHRFEIGDDVYRETLRHAVRVFFYQRSGFAKQTPFADPRWTDAASHLGPGQDTACRLVTDPGNAALQKDLSGGWYDAGDYNKYVNFTYSTLHNLLFAYQHNPAIWTDDFGIPESGNGRPDLLDEILWELQWLKRMQQANGSVLSKVSVTGFQSASPPSADTAPRYYGAASTSSTLTVASVFAHAARVFASAGYPAESADLLNRAIQAWNWAAANPSVTFNNTGFSSANPEVSSYERNMRKLAAAIHLYAATGNTTYRSYVEANYLTANPMQWWYFYAYETPIQDALMEYTTLPGAGATVKNEIRSRKQASMGGSEFLPAYTGSTDAYRAYLKDSDYTWGSNQNKAHVGLIFLAQNIYGLDTANATTYRAAAAGYLHYLHGANPNGLVFLTNMAAAGAEKSCNEMYHGWFGDGTPYDNAQSSPLGPASGYLTGGPNPNYNPDWSYSGPPIEPPKNQPVQKAYRDWNTSWPENSWEVTEPAIYYQAAYVRLLSSFVRPLTYSNWAAGYQLTGGPQADQDNDGIPNLVEYATGTRPEAPDTAAPLTLQAGGAQLSWKTARWRPDVTVTLEKSSDLVTWTPVTGVSRADLPANSYIQNSFTDTDTSPRRFYRLRALLTP